MNNSFNSTERSNRPVVTGKHGKAKTMRERSKLPLIFEFDVEEHRRFRGQWSHEDFHKLSPESRLIMAVGQSAMFSSHNYGQVDYIKRIFNKGCPEQEIVPTEAIVIQLELASQEELVNYSIDRWQLDFAAAIMLEQHRQMTAFRRK